MKTYQGTRGPNGRAAVTVADSTAVLPLAARRDLRNHSPDSLEWGHAGSGPSQLALALLADHFGPGPGAERLAAALYQDFKFAVVARLPEPGWTLTGEEIGQALCRLAAEQTAHFWGRVFGALDAELFQAATATGNDPADAELARAAVEIVTRLLPVSAEYARQRAARHYQQEEEQP